jgi:hypothetical protein
MAGSLIKLDEEIVTSAVASVTIGDTDWDSSYDVYMVRINNLAPSTDNTTLQFRTTSSGVPNTTATYDRAFLRMKSDTAFQPRGGSNETYFNFATNIGTGTSETMNAIFYLFNFNNASEYSHLTVEANNITSGGVLTGNQGGHIHTLQTACDGLQFFMSSGNIASGKFVLYGLKNS